MPLDSSQYLNPSWQVLRVSAALPAAGALDAAPLTMPVEGWTEMTLLCAYTRGALGGAVRMVIECSYSPAPTVWYQTTVVETGAVVAGADTHSVITHEDFTWTSGGAAIERFQYQFELPSNVEYVRVACQEVGVVGTPGTMAITGIASY